jgi:chromatin assembly factor 1 subunit B
LNLRNNLHKTPSAFIGGFEKAAISIRFNPKLFTLIPDGPEPYVTLPYRMIFAVVTQNSVYIFDTQNRAPLFMFANLHYASLTDVTWSSDGAKLVASSVDGFCTVSEFDIKNDFNGEILSSEESERIFKEIPLMVKSVPFFNPVKKKQSQNVSNLQQENSFSVPLSSEIDVIIEKEDEEMSESIIEEAQRVNSDIEVIPKSEMPITNVATVIHNPPVKRRITPTLLSKD